MKKIVTAVILLMICTLSYNVITASPDSRFFPIKQRAADWVQSIRISKADYQRQLDQKRAELEAYEKGLEWAEEAVTQMVTAPRPVCPTTGLPASMTITGDPRDEVREKISKLKEEIANLQDKIEH